MTMSYAITAGFVPLLDSALLVVAKEKGFAEAQSIDLTLVREQSWASIRDRLAVRHFDVAHILGPMPIACNLGLSENDRADGAGPRRQRRHRVRRALASDGRRGGKGRP
jgi:ABC-type nitrate/sulfonate/bicarbonate transport system substrate-binding protein